MILNGKLVTQILKLFFNSVVFNSDNFWWETMPGVEKIFFTFLQDHFGFYIQNLFMVRTTILPLHLCFIICCNLMFSVAFSSHRVMLYINITGKFVYLYRWIFHHICLILILYIFIQKICDLHLEIVWISLQQDSICPQDGVHPW